VLQYSIVGSNADTCHVNSCHLVCVTGYFARGGQVCEEVCQGDESNTIKCWHLRGFLKVFVRLSDSYMT
jgi:hypothetical protein